MNCPYCNRALELVTERIHILPKIAPLLCSGCAEVSLLIDHATVREITSEEMGALQQSDCWRYTIAPAQKGIRFRNFVRKVQDN